MQAHPKPWIGVRSARIRGTQGNASRSEVGNDGFPLVANHQERSTSLGGSNNQGTVIGRSGPPRRPSYFSVTPATPVRQVSPPSRMIQRHPLAQKTSAVQRTVRAIWNHRDARMLLAQIANGLLNGAPAFGVRPACRRFGMKKGRQSPRAAHQPLPALPQTKAGASSTHSKRWRDARRPAAIHSR